MIFKVLSHSLRFSPTRCGEPWFNHKVLNQECMFTNTTRLFRKSRKIPISKSNNDKVRRGINISSEGGHSRKISLSRLWKPFIFTASFTAGAVVVCTVWQFEKKRALFVKYRKRIWEYPSSKLEEDLSFRELFNKLWKNCTESEKLFCKILAVNFVVYLGWRIPKLRDFMVKYFTSNSAKPSCWPLVLSTFSHYNLLHFIINMTALCSFMRVAMRSLEKEDFMALYLTAGVVSSFVSLLHRVIMGRVCLSVGASGAIMGVVGYVAAKNPNLEFSFLIPVLSLPASTALKCLIAVDVLGVCLKWRFIDHASHLGGVCWGLYWYYRGENYFWGRKGVITDWWMSLAKPKQ